MRSTYGLSRPEKKLRTPSLLSAVFVLLFPYPFNPPRTWFASARCSTWLPMEKKSSRSSCNHRIDACKSKFMPTLAKYIYFVIWFYKRSCLTYYVRMILFLFNRCSHTLWEHSLILIQSFLNKCSIMKCFLYFLGMIPGCWMCLHLLLTITGQLIAEVSYDGS